MWTALAHIPLKENQNHLLAIASLSGPPDTASPVTTNMNETCGSLATHDESYLDDSESIITITDCFGMYQLYSHKLLHNPSHCSSLNTDCDSQSISDCQLRTVQNQESCLDMQTVTTPYYFPFSNLSATAMMVAHHSGTPVQSAQQTTNVAHILESLGPDLNPLHLCNFNTALENKRLDAYLASASESAFHPEDGWIESSVQI